MKIAKRILFTFLILLLVLGGTGLWLLFGSRTSNPKNYAHIGEIPTPSGYERVVGTNPGYTQFLRALPLKPKGSKVHLYTGGKAFFQPMNYAVVDLPLLSNAEQCADACMRLRAEYFYQTGQYHKIKIQNVNGNTQRYSGGASREALHPTLWRRQHLLPLSRNAAPYIGRNPTRRCLCLPRQRSISWSRRPRRGRRCQQGREKGLSPRRGQHPRLRYSSHPQLRKPISLPVVHDRRQREEIPLVSHPLQSNRLEA